MKAEIVRFLFPVAVLLVCGAFEEAIPRVLSVGFPLLMTAALILGALCSRTEAVLLAVLAGSLEDALGGMPVATTSSFLVLATLCARVSLPSWFVPFLAYPVFQVWLVVWSMLPAGALWMRLLVSVPVAAVTVLVVYPVLLTLERRLAADAC